MIRTAIPFAFAFFVLLSAGSAQATPKSGKALFVQNCARCHTTSGAGMPTAHPLLTNFYRPPTDFTDALFNSTEPEKDWFNVVKYGGAVMGLSTQMPAHKERLTDNEIRKVVKYLGTLADTRSYPKGDLNFRRPISTIKAFPETELLLLGRFEESTAGPASWKSTLYHARRVGPQAALEVKLSELSTSEETKLDELEVGVKWAVLRAGTSFLLSIGAEAAFFFGNFDEPEFIPYSSYALPLGNRFTLQGAVKSHLPSQGISQGDVATSHVIHWLPSSFPRGVFPGLEAVASMTFEEQEVSLVLIPQLFFAFSKLGHVGLGLGAEIPVKGMSYDYRVQSFLFWDMADGPFWEGW